MPTNVEKPATVTEWSSNLNTSLPIHGNDIPGFVSWVNGNGFNFDRTSRKGHAGFDFGAYLRDDGAVIVGLPKETPVRAVADGVVRQILIGDMTGGAYGGLINVEHGKENSGMFSGYVHIEPQIRADTKVEKGDIIGTLHQDSGIEGRLVHLHLRLLNGWYSGDGDYSNRLQDPALIDPSIYDLTPETQNWEPFNPVQSLGAKTLSVANFDIVNVNNFSWKR
jgi:murein DD-endopeptidase MepM/ murein hydrolase activator NlpD